MYTPNLGVWMQRDPAEEGLNLYAYTADNPTNLVDPSGLKFDSLSARAWKAAESYAMAQGWGVSSAILQHFNELSNSDGYALGDWGPTLDLSDTAASGNIGKKEGAAILDAIKKWAAGSVNRDPVTSVPRTKVSDKYETVYDRAKDADLYWGVHGATIYWTADAEVDQPKKSADGCSYIVKYKIYSIEARLEDDFDFNAGQFKSFPAKLLNDIGTVEGVPFHIRCELTGFTWNTDNTVTVPVPAKK
jgi:hypothetical protein